MPAVGDAASARSGAAWKDLTHKPFVFAVWITRRGTDLGNLPERLRQARDRGLADLPTSLPATRSRAAGPRTWPCNICRNI